MWFCSHMLVYPNCTKHPLQRGGGKALLSFSKWDKLYKKHFMWVLYFQLDYLGYLHSHLSSVPYVTTNARYFESESFGFPSGHPSFPCFQGIPFIVVTVVATRWWQSFILRWSVSCGCWCYLLVLVLRDCWALHFSCSHGQQIKWDKCCSVVTPMYSAEFYSKSNDRRVPGFRGFLQ